MCNDSAKTIAPSINLELGKCINLPHFKNPLIIHPLNIIPDNSNYLFDIKNGHKVFLSLQNKFFRPQCVMIATTQFFASKALQQQVSFSD